MSIFKKIGKFVVKKAKEPSTYVGLATATAALGLPGGPVISMLGMLVGGGLIGHSPAPKQ